MLSTAYKNVINLYYQELDKKSFYPLNFLILGRHCIIQILKRQTLIIFALHSNSGVHN